MPLKFFSFIIAAVILAATDPASGQQPIGKVPRIGFLTSGSASDHRPDDPTSVLYRSHRVIK